MKDRKKTILIEIIIVLVIVGLIILTGINFISLNNMKTEKSKQSHSEQVTLDSLDSDLIRPKYSVYLFSKYVGQCSQTEIIESLDKLAMELIPKYYVELKGKSDEQIHQYYIKNNLDSNIEGTNIAIEDEETFKQILKEFNTLNSDSLKFLKFNFERDSINIQTDGVKATVSIDYAGNEKIKLNIFIKNDKGDNGIVLEVCK